MGLSDNVQSQQHHPLNRSAYTLNSVSGLPADVTEHQKILRQKIASLRQRYFDEPLHPEDAPFYEGERIAPFNELQKKVHTQTGKLLARENKYLTPSVQKNFEKSSDVNVGKKVEDLVRGSYADPSQTDAYANYTANPRFNQLIKDMREQSTEHLTKELLPKITNSYLANGAYYSSARKAAEKQAIERNNKHLDRQINEMLHKMHQEGTQVSERQMERQQQAASLVGGAYGSQQQQARENFNAAQNVERSALANQLASLTAAGSVGEGQQNLRQKQNAAAMEQYYEPSNKQEEMLTKEAALTANQPMPIFQRQSMGETPPQQPSVYQHVAGALQGLMAQPKATGGRVKKRAAGGAMEATPDMPPQYTDQQLPVMQNPEMQHLMAQQQHMSQPDPDAQRMYWARILGGIAGADPRYPHAGYVEGMNKAMDEQQTNKKSRQERSDAIAEAIQNSRVDQVKMMHLYEKNRRDHLFDMMKEKNTHQLLSAKNAREQEEHEWKRGENEGGNAFGLPKPRKMDAEDRKIVDHAREAIENIDHVIGDLDTIIEHSTRGSDKFVDSGGLMERTGILNWEPLRAMAQKGSLTNMDSERTATASLVTKLAKLEGNGRYGLGMTNFIKEGKVDEKMTPEAKRERAMRLKEDLVARRNSAEIVMKGTHMGLHPIQAEGYIDTYKKVQKEYPNLTPDDFYKMLRGEEVGEAEHEEAAPKNELSLYDNWSDEDLEKIATGAR